ncbi:hypothetical protein [Endozoicomonas sp. 4G]|uniref:hypothetical protein n=1 Tax=Endozoicomonas sp. 4G TaxID=2872754 RepID=UPI002078C661|nr:hypothetical protein [Endozoicomonas sp. 4G]
MKKNYQTQAVCRFLFFCIMMQMVTIQQAMAADSLADPMSLSSLFPLLATVYRGTPEAKNSLPVLDPPPQSVQIPGNIGDSPDSFDPFFSVVSLQYRQIKSQLTFQDSIGLKLDEEESLVLAPSEFPAVAKVSNMADENWPQLIAAESVGSDTSGIRSVFKWADQWRLNAFPDDPLLRFLAFIHGAAFCVQDNSGQLSYIIQRNGKLLSVSRFEAYLQFSLYSQSFLESLYPEIFGPSLPAGGGWHEWNRYVRKQPFHPYKKSKKTNNSSGAQRPLSPYGNNESSTRSETRATHRSERNSEQAQAPGTTSTERDGRQEHINQQKVEAIYDYKTPENDHEKATALYATAFLDESQQHLHCPVCDGFITGEAKACNSSRPHSVCIGCFNSMKKAKVPNIEQCVTCRGKVCGGSFNYKDAAAAILFQCPLGCNHRCPLAFMKNHIKEHYSDNTLEGRSEAVSQGEGEQGIPPGSVLFYGVPITPEDKERVEQFLLTCRQINDPEHLQLAETFTRLLESAQNRCQQLASGHSGQQSTGAACHSHNSSNDFFNFGGSSLDSAYLQCLRNVGQRGGTCRFCNSELWFNQGVTSIQEHLNQCYGPVYCPNVDNGCTFRHRPAIMPMHLLKCRYNKAKCQICLQQVASEAMNMHRERCLSSVQLGQGDAFFYDRTEQTPIQIIGELNRDGTVLVYKVPEEDTYYCKISRLFYESITNFGIKSGFKRGRHRIKFIGNDPNDSGGFSIEFQFDEGESSLSFRIFSEENHRRMALPVIFNEEGKKLVEETFVLRGHSSCDVCGYRVDKDTMTHPDPYPICLSSLTSNLLYSNDQRDHNSFFPSCIYVQIKLTPVER